MAHCQQQPVVPIVLDQNSALSQMKSGEVTRRITELCNDEELSFRDKVGKVQAEVDQYTKTDLRDHLDYAGVIPECSSHDSTEEKLFAKYCDVLLARAWRELGLEAESIEERADSADVFAKGEDYEMVGDAKAFRLSGTAKNQKDFKVGVLSLWRKDADYAS
jgi:hypothetical protein